MSAIKKVHARRVWDSRGYPTIEVEVRLDNGGFGRAIAPAGASTGSGEALDLRDGGRAFGGYGVDKALGNVKQKIATAITGRDGKNQELIDNLLIELDGSDRRQNLGGNAMIATSMAVAHAAADGENQPLWQYLGGSENNPLPTPEIQIFGGGAHAGGHMDLQDFMVVPYGAGSFAEAMEWTAEIYLAAGKKMTQLGKRYGVADEGGYWPAFNTNEEAIETLTVIIEEAGFSTKTQVGISLDIAATQIVTDHGYYLKKENRSLCSEAWFDLMLQWLRDYPVIAIEDPFHEQDLASHARLLQAMDKGVQLVGDDLLVTNLKQIEAAREMQACNTLLCKPNQAGTLSEAKAAHRAAVDAGWNTIISARSGETEDTTIVHLAIAWGIGQLKVGSFARSERMAKWNEAIRLEEDFGANARYAGGMPFGTRT